MEHLDLDGNIKWIYKDTNLEYTISNIFYNRKDLEMKQKYKSQSTNHFLYENIAKKSINII